MADEIEMVDVPEGREHQLREAAKCMGATRVTYSDIMGHEITFDWGPNHPQLKFRWFPGTMLGPGGWDITVTAPHNK